MANAWGVSWGFAWGSSWGTSASSAFDLPLPVGMSFNDWAARVAETLAQFNVPSPFHESRWQEWACALFYASDLTKRGIPSPEGFSDWRLWAQRFIESMR